MIKRVVNKLLVRTTGYQLVKSADAPSRDWPVDAKAREALFGSRRPERIAEVIGPTLQPVFVLSPPHRGLNVLGDALGAHDDIHRLERVAISGLGIRTTRDAEQRFAAAGISYRDLQNMLLDHLVRDLLARSGKRFVAVADDNVTTMWGRLKDVWPSAHFIYLLRDPRVLAAAAMKGERVDAERLARICACAVAVDNARKIMPGLTLRYEDLESDPEARLQEICAFLGVAWQEDVGLALKQGLATGKTAKVPAKKIPRELRPLIADWGYA